MGKPRGRGRPFPPGQSGNPKGRPPGIKDRLPRGFVARLVLATLEANEAAACEAFRRMLTNPRQVRDALELAGRLNKEIGAAALDALPTATITVYTNLDPNALRTVSVPALAAPVVEEPEP